MELSEKTLNEIEVAARRCYPEEACGVVLADGSWYEMENIYVDEDNPEDTSCKNKHFELNAAELYLLKETKGIAYIVHSHTQSHALHICTPSMTDVQLQKQLDIPFIIVGFNGQSYFPPMYLPTRRSRDYLNRRYIYGLQDCGTLLQDYYFFELGIELKILPELSLAVKKEWAKAVATAGELYEFTLLGKDTALQVGDVLLVSIAGGRKNHTCIYIGNATVLNQAEYSLHEPLSMWINKLEGVYRHKSLLC